MDIKDQLVVSISVISILSRQCWLQQNNNRPIAYYLNFNARGPWFLKYLKS